MIDKIFTYSLTIDHQFLTATKHKTPEYSKLDHFNDCLHRYFLLEVAKFDPGLLNFFFLNVGWLLKNILKRCVALAEFKEKKMWYTILERISLWNESFL